jgi:hypothetical protein
MTWQVMVEKPIAAESIEREVIKPVELRVDVPIVKHCPVVTETITKEVIKPVKVEVVREVIKCALQANWLDLTLTWRGLT